MENTIQRKLIQDPKSPGEYNFILFFSYLLDFFFFFCICQEELPTPTKRRRIVRHQPSTPRKVEDITQEELDMVADSVKDKEYDSNDVSHFMMVQ